MYVDVKVQLTLAEIAAMIARRRVAMLLGGYDWPRRRHEWPSAIGCWCCIDLCAGTGDDLITSWLS